jgi:hypothetical protein
MSWWTSKEIHPKTKDKFVVVFGGVFYLPNIKTINKPKVEFETKEYRLINHKFNYPGNATWEPITMKFVDMNGMGRKTEHFDTAAFLWQIMNNTGYSYPYVDNSQFRDPHFRNVYKGTGGDKKKAGLEYGSGHHISTKLKLDGKNKTWRRMTTPEKSSTIANSFGLGLEDVADFKAASQSKQRISIYQLAPYTGNEDVKKNAFIDDLTPKGAIITECWHLINPIVKSINWGDLDYSSDELVEYELGVVYDWAVMDRTQIGEKFDVSEIPYKQFMKTLFVDNEEAIFDQKLKVANFNKESADPLHSIDGVLDLDRDGKISPAERNLAGDVDIKIATTSMAFENQREENSKIVDASLASMGEEIEKKEIAESQQRQAELQEGSVPKLTKEDMIEKDKPGLPPIETEGLPAGLAAKLEKINQMEAKTPEQRVQEEERQKEIQALTDPSHGSERKIKK